jgi:hypothetical protein
MGERVVTAMAALIVQTSANCADEAAPRDTSGSLAAGL